METRDYVIVTENGYINSTATLPSNTPIAGDDLLSAHDEPPLILSNGSARLTTLDMKETILCSVKAQVIRPSPNRPDRGVLEVSVDKLSAGNQSELDEIQSLLSHLLLADDTSLVDRSSLCILAHEYVWKLSIDLVFLGSSVSATSRLHAISGVVHAALESTRLPVITAQDNTSPLTTSNNQEQVSLIVQDDIHYARPVISTDDQAFTIVSIALLPCSSLQQQPIVMIVDASSEEQACALGQVHVAIQICRSSKRAVQEGERARVCAVHASGKIPLQLLPEIMQMAVNSAEKDYARKPSYRHAAGHYSLLQEPFGLQ